MSVVNTLNFLINHPLTKHDKFGSFLRFLKWQIGIRLNPYPTIVPFVGGTNLVVEKGMAGATGNVYAGLHEFTDMGFLLHFLREGDNFLDIGANVGSYSVLASGVCKANTLAFEPSSYTYSRLVRNITINNLNPLVKTLQVALGSEKGTVNFTKSLDTVNHVQKSDNSSTDTEVIPLDILDRITGELIAPTLVKIDVEGFETEVLNGANQLLKNFNTKAIIIELNGSGWRYGYDESKIHQLLISHRFKAMNYDPFTRCLQNTSYFGTHNTIYIRDIEFVNKRVMAGPKIKVLDIEF